jgi:opacity protein-like surface antigen
LREKTLSSTLAAACLALLGASPAPADPLLPGKPLPTLALNPQPAPSLWTGLYVGTEVFAISRKGSKGLFGGDAFAGYDHQFANNVVLGVQASAGFAPGWSSASRFKGFDFAAADVKLGYPVGRLMPYVTAGLALEKAHLGPGGGFQGSESLNALLRQGGELHAATRVGVGVDYAVTNNLTVGVAVHAFNGAGPLVP